ncbi:MAG: GHKL domain-containing protein [Ruminococcus flavefaciens]|nr:GHKL domain-containing protein [Ruminococcus flavefaciens]
MTIFYQFTELLATFIEGFLVLTVASKLSYVKYSKTKNSFLILLFTVIYTVLITAMNKWNTFSFVTLLVCIAYTYIVTKIITKGSFLLQATSTILSWFAVSAIDYLLSYSLIMFIGHSVDISKGVDLILSPGRTRVIFLFINKLAAIIIFIALNKIYPQLRTLSNKYLAVLLTITSCSYIVMSIITSFIMSDSILTLQISVIFSLLFIILSLTTTIFAVTLNSRYQAAKHERHLMEVTNQLMEKNYKTIQLSQNIIRQQVHDFKNHIRTINGMLSDDTKAKKYTDELLEISYAQAQYCHCENEVINSIINCKMASANTLNISFKHSIILTSPIYISSVDICAILSNQIDNAIEACEKMPSESPKDIKVEIWQKESFLFFKVTNSTDKNPFNDKKELVSTKTNSAIHGFGIKNIRETVSKYDGELINEYKNGNFISIATVMNTE